MAWIIQSKCTNCHHQVGPLEEGQASVFYCRRCNDYQTVGSIPRRFELPYCKDCGTQYLQKNRLSKNGKSVCPECKDTTLEWEVIAHMQMTYVPEELPLVGDIVQGYTTNTGTIQRIELVNSQMRGRIAADEPLFPDGTPVEGEVVGLGRRSLDVSNITILAGIQKLERAEQVVPAKSDRAGG